MENINEADILIRLIKDISCFFRYKSNSISVFKVNLFGCKNKEDAKPISRLFKRLFNAKGCMKLSLRTQTGLVCEVKILDLINLSILSKTIF